MHTDEDITITFKREGRYDEAALEKLNWFLRDWRKQQETKMDPHLIDLIWEVQRETGSKEPIWVVCGYRSPETNAMLRRRAPASHVSASTCSAMPWTSTFPAYNSISSAPSGLRLQRGGVGFYPTSGSPFVHMDTGGIRMWPRMTREQLVRVFPDQRTVYVRPTAVRSPATTCARRYQEARWHWLRCRRERRRCRRGRPLRSVHQAPPSGARRRRRREPTANAGTPPPAATEQ